MARQVGAWTAVTAVALAAALGGCGTGGERASDGGTTPRSEAEFVARADRICLEANRDFAELPPPVGGAKPVGIGTFMRAWTAKLRVPTPPTKVADHWKAGLDLLDRAAGRLDDAESGDPDAQSEALWGLEARAQRHFEAMRLPFRVCFVE